MDVREKLVEICFHEFCMVAGDSPCGCDGCPYGKYGSENGECYEAYRKHKLEKLEKAGVTVQEWISVKDKLPDVGSIVLVIDNETDCHIWQYTDYSERGVAMPWTDEFGIPCKTEEITHWKPMPQPPKGE